MLRSLSLSPKVQDSIFRNYRLRQLLKGWKLWLFSQSKCTAVTKRDLNGLRLWA